MCSVPYLLFLLNRNVCSYLKNMKNVCVSVAISAIQMNCAMNAVNVSTCSMDLVGHSCDDWDCILLGDMFYDSEFAQRLIEWLQHLSRRGKQVFIGDPGRHAFKQISQSDLTQVATYSMPDYLCMQNNGFTDAVVWKLG